MTDHTQAQPSNILLQTPYFRSFDSEHAYVGGYRSGDAPLVVTINTSPEAIRKEFDEAKKPLLIIKNPGETTLIQPAAIVLCQQDATTPAHVHAFFESGCAGAADATIDDIVLAFEQGSSGAPRHVTVDNFDRITADSPATRFVALDVYNNGRVVRGLLNVPKILGLDQAVINEDETIIRISTNFGFSTHRQVTHVWNTIRVPYPFEDAEKIIFPADPVRVTRLERPVTAAYTP